MTRRERWVRVLSDGGSQHRREGDGDVLGMLMTMWCGQWGEHKEEVERQAGLGG